MQLGVRTTENVQRRLREASAEDGEQILRLAHRTMVLDALQALPRKALPRDLGALGIVVEAAELFATALYFSRGTSMTKGFVGEGLEEFQEWLQRCRSLFERYDRLFDELPAPSKTSGDPRKVAAAYWGVVNRMFRSIMEHQEIRDAAREESPDEESEPDGQTYSLQDIVAIPGETLKEIATALGSIMCCWMKGTYVDGVMAAIADGHDALTQCRPLIAVADPQSTRGNA